VINDGFDLFELAVAEFMSVGREVEARVDQVGAAARKWDERFHWF